MKRGPKPRRSDGYTLSEKGYLQRTDSERRKHYAHREVWIRQYGPIPDGMQIHHRNGDKLDNRIENLQLVTPEEHRRIHLAEEGITTPGGKRRCAVCRELKLLSSEGWYFTKAGAIKYGRCRPCHRAIVYRERRDRRQAATP